jgi:hypothetical protein
MSEDASYEIQVALVALFKNSARLASLVQGRIFDRAPRDQASGNVKAEFPFISLGQDSEIPLDADRVRSTDFILPIDVWSRGVGYVEVKRIARAIEDELHERELPLTDNAFVALEYQGRDIIRDPDGLTSRAALRFAVAVDKF